MYFSKDTKGAASVTGESHEEFLVFQITSGFQKGIMLEKSRKATALQVFVKTQESKALGIDQSLAPGCLVLRGSCQGHLLGDSSLNQPHPSWVCQGLHKTHS